jgi:4-hydroxy-3-polyprenylbenzoate decarboxylase
VPPKEDALTTQDLRSWIAKMDAAGEIQHISGAEREEEIGGIVDFYQRKTGNPAVLFDDIPGYPKGHRVLANILTSIKRIHLTLGHAPDATAMDLVHYWRRHMKEAKAIPPKTVKSGALLENVSEGKNIDIFKIPVPKWHELDGGLLHRHRRHGGDEAPRFRLGELRRLSRAGQESGTASIMCSKGKHGDLIMRSYHEKGEPCPIAVVCGMHPSLFMIAGLEIPTARTNMTRRAD